MRPIILSTNRPFKREVFLICLVGYIFAVLLGVPFLRFFRPLNSQGTFNLSYSMQLIVANAIGLLIAMIGLLLSRRVGLGLPFIEGMQSRKPVWVRARGVLGLGILVSVGSIILVLLSSIVIIALAMVFHNNALDAFANFDESTYPTTWQWLLAAFYAGISEELVFRLGLMTIFAWLGSLVHQDESGRSSDLVMWVSIIVVGIMFGIGHLWGVLPVSEFWIMRFRVVFQNSLIGILLGWLFWKFGLESAILTHILIDIGFYVVFVPVSRSNNLVLIGLALVMLTFIVSWAWKALESDRLITDRFETNDEISTV